MNFTCYFPQVPDKMTCSSHELSVLQQFYELGANYYHTHFTD